MEKKITRNWDHFSIVNDYLTVAKDARLTNHERDLPGSSSIQVAPFWHGMVSLHSLMFSAQFIPFQPKTDLQSLFPALKKNISY